MPAISETRTYDSILTSTIAKYMTDTFIDNINKANGVFYILNKAPYKRTQNGGERIEIPLRIAKSAAGGWYENYDLLSMNPADPLTKSFYPWRQIHYSVIMSRLEERKNAGVGRLLNLLQALMDDAEDSMTEDINTGLFATIGTTGLTGANAKAFDSLPILVSLTPGNANEGRNIDGYVGAIKGSTNTWWKNKVIGRTTPGGAWTGIPTSSAMAPNLWKVMEAAFESASKGGGSKSKREPNIGIFNQKMYQEYLLGLTPERRFTNTELGDIGFRNIEFNGLPIMWDEAVDVGGYNLDIDATSVMCGYFLNKNYLHLTVDSETDFYHTPFIRPANQDARVMNILWMGNFGVSSRRKHVVMADSASVTEVL